MVDPELVKGLNGKLVTKRRRAWQYAEVGLILVAVLVVHFGWQWLTRH